MDYKEKLKTEFNNWTGKKAEYLFFAPGRVNLIGEHIDYNGGLVFPCALTVGTYLLIRKREDNLLNFKSLNFEETLTISLDNLQKTQQWFDYPIGVLRVLQEKGLEPSGMDLLFMGTIPNGAGLSSSASIEVVTAYALSAIFKLNLDKVELVKLSKYVENNYVGVSSGIMDQFAVGMGKKDHAIALNCDTLEYTYAPMILGEYCLLIGNTNVQRKLIDSKYNERLAECREALAIVQKTFDVEHLCELTPAQLQSVAMNFENKTILRRARHVVSEQARVLQAVALLQENDLQGFGQLMNASHDSLRDDYEVTGLALDTMVVEGRKISGVLGSRMTGAGFGGCTVTLLHKDAVANFIKKVGTAYQEKVGLVSDFYVANIGNGVEKLAI